MAHVSRKKELIQADIETLLRAWQRKFPHEVRAVMDEADAVRSGLYRENGMSADRLLLIKRVMSERLSAAMGTWFGKQWQEDKDVVPVFDSVCRKFLINTTSVPKLGGAPSFMDGAHYDSTDNRIIGEILAERDAE